MNTLFRLASILFLGGVSVLGLWASPAKPHVCVPPSLNLTGLASFEAGAKAARDTVVTLLGQTGKFTLVPWKGPAAGTGTDFSKEADTLGLDFLVLIQLEKAADNKAVCRMRVWDRTKNAFTFEKVSEPVQLLDIFEASDLTATEALEKLTGGHLAFGSILLKPRGGTSLYSIRLDDQVLEPERLSRVVAGTHSLEIREGTAENSPDILKISPLTVAEGVATEVVFLTPEPTKTSEAAPKVETVPQEYKIGGWGPGLGYVFFDKGYYSEGWRYLEANPKAFQVSIQGANFSHEQGGFTDWRLPTIDEMKVIRAQLQEKGLEVYPREKYMTADRASDSVYIYDLGWGTQGTWSLRGTAAAFFYVIPVRAF